MNRNEKCSTIFDRKRQLHRLTCSDYMRRRTLFNCSGTCELLMTRTKMTRMAVEFYWTILTDFLLIETLGKLTPDVCLVAKDCWPLIVDPWYWIGVDDLRCYSGGTNDGNDGGTYDRLLLADDVTAEHWRWRYETLRYKNRIGFCPKTQDKRPTTRRTWKCLAASASNSDPEIPFVCFQGYSMNFEHCSGRLVSSEAAFGLHQNEVYKVDRKGAPPKWRIWCGDERSLRCFASLCLCQMREPRRLHSRCKPSHVFQWTQSDDLRATLKCDSLRLPSQDHAFIRNLDIPKLPRLTAFGNISFNTVINRAII